MIGNEKNKFSYIWNLKNANFTKDKGKVFSCFACGGGSTMGYKLAGFDVIGCNEIDPKMMKAYIANHNPKYPFLEPIQNFKNRNDLPEELFDLDILDGSPPCSSFSIAGNRDDDWGKEKKFREGQAEQILDTLFFDFIDLAKKLKPKIVVAENVKGLLLGDAKAYVLKIYEEFDKANYYVRHWLLDASTMGVPQKRERVFFLAIRKDIGSPFIEQFDMFSVAPRINLNFNEPKILFKEFKEKNNNQYPLSDFYKSLWEKRIDGDADFSNINQRERGRPNTGFGTNFLYENNVCGTLTSKKDCYCLYDEPRYTSDFEAKCIGTYPQDYDFCGNKPEYLIGMSVPPVMTAQIALRIYDEWLSKMNAKK